ncbi:hypothetical protein CC79DRAFT_1328717 [Sarocladium strictum]
MPHSPLRVRATVVASPLATQSQSPESRRLKLRDASSSSSSSKLPSSSLFLTLFILSYPHSLITLRSLLRFDTP